MKRGICFVTSLALLALCAMFRVSADESADSRRFDAAVSVLVPQIDLKVEEGEFSEAERLTQNLILLESARYGADNWRIRSSKVLCDCYLQMARLPPDDQKRVRRALRMLEIGLDRLNEFKLADALRLYEGGIEILNQVAGERNFFAIDAASCYARTLSLMGDHEKAKRVAARAAENSQQLFGSDSVYSANATEVLGEVYARAGMLKEAETRLRLAEKSYVRLFDGELVKNRLLTNVHLVEILNDSGRYQEAEPLARAAVKIADQQKPKITELYIRARAGLARSLHGDGKAEAAQDEFADVMGIVAGLQIPSGFKADLISQYVIVLDDLGRTKEADAYREEIRDLKRPTAGNRPASDDELAVPPE